MPDTSPAVDPTPDEETTSDRSPSFVVRLLRFVVAVAVLFVVVAAVSIWKNGDQRREVMDMLPMPPSVMVLEDTEAPKKDKALPTPPPVDQVTVDLAVRQRGQQTRLQGLEARLDELERNLVDLGKAQRALSASGLLPHQRVALAVLTLPQDAAPTPSLMQEVNLYAPELAQMLQKLEAHRAENPYLGRYDLVNMARNLPLPMKRQGRFGERFTYWLSTLVQVRRLDAPKDSPDPRNKLVDAIREGQLAQALTILDTPPLALQPEAADLRRSLLALEHEQDMQKQIYNGALALLMREN